MYYYFMYFRQFLHLSEIDSGPGFQGNFHMRDIAEAKEPASCSADVEKSTSWLAAWRLRFLPSP